MAIIKEKMKKNKLIRNVYNEINKRFVKILVRHSPILASKYIYKRSTGKKLNLKEPKDFNEKIQWLKLYWQHPLVVKCADKYEVRSYIEECGCDEILNQLYGVYDNVSEINWDVLPRKFALKTTNSSGTNIICDNKDILNINEVSKKLNEWLITDYGQCYAEIHYSKMKPRLICEKYIETDKGIFPNDYKIFCFNGEPKFLYVGIIENGFTHKTFYDLEWNKLHFLKDGYQSYDHEKPNCLDEMIKYANILSKPFPFVRVDFYDYNGKPLFGEMTFTPTGGLANYYNESTLYNLGNMLKLPEKYNG